MEFEAAYEDTISRLVVPAGTAAVKVGTVIALLLELDELHPAAKKPAGEEPDEAALQAAASAPMLDGIAEPVGKQAGGQANRAVA